MKTVNRKTAMIVVLPVVLAWLNVETVSSRTIVVNFLFNGASLETISNVVSQNVSARPAPTTCGDTAGQRGKPVRCSCGNTVVTSTILRTGDPVVKKACSGDGLTLAAGVVLDLNGLTISGSGSGTGVTLAAGGTVRDGTVSDFGTGIAATGGNDTLSNLLIELNSGNGLLVGQPDGSGAPDVSFTGAGSTVSDNGGTGIVVHPSASLNIDGTGGRVATLRNAARGLESHGTLIADFFESAQNTTDGVFVDTASGAALKAVDIHDNAGYGIFVLRAQGDSVDNAIPHFEPLASFTLRSGGVNASVLSKVHGNQLDGIVLGDQTSQTGIVNAQVRNTDIYSNGAGSTSVFGGAGLRIEEKDETTASTHWFLAANNIYDNSNLGIHLRPSFPIAVATDIDRRAFIGNLIHHNGQPNNPTCSLSVPSQAPQIWIEGRMAYRDPACPCDPQDTSCTNGPPTEAQCTATTDPLTNQDGIRHWCAWEQAAGSCTSAYPLYASACDFGIASAIYNYEGDVGGGFLSVGLFVSNRAATDVSNNSWQFGGINGRDWISSGNADDLVVSSTTCPSPPSSCP